MGLVYITKKVFKLRKSQLVTLRPLVYEVDVVWNSSADSYTLIFFWVKEVASFT